MSVHRQPNPILNCQRLAASQGVVTRKDPMPVLFWIHGGGWLSGAGHLYEPHMLLDKDVLLVNINYRLGPLGTLS